jgi:glycosyltransferase involved in cell wall biosynthesis
VKLLVIVPYFDEPHRWMISGQKTAYELAKKHDVIVLTTGTTNRVEQRSDRLTIYRLKDIFLPDPINYSVVPTLFHAIQTILKRNKLDLCIINKHMFFTSLAIWPLKWHGCKVIVQTDTFPGINWFPKNKFVGIVMWLYARLIGNPILRAADVVVILHEGLESVAQQLKLRYRVIHNGIDLTDFDAIKPPQDLKKKKGEIWVGYVGRLESIKGWYDLADVAKRLVATDSRLHFFFVGPTARAEARIREFTHPRIHFLGHRSDVAGIDKLLDIFVMPSLSEGLSNAIMEAMAASCCVVASNVGGNVILIKDKVTGRLFPVGDREALAEVLTSLCATMDTTKKLGRHARQLIESDYSLSLNVKKLVQLI